MKKVSVSRACSEGLFAMVLLVLLALVAVAVGGGQVQVLDK